MTLDEMQAAVHAWIDQFEEGYWHPLSMLARLTEEVGEFAREINHRFGEKPKKAGEDVRDVRLELADVLFVLTCFANSLDISLEEAFREMMAKYRERDSGRWTPKRKSAGNSEVEQ